MNTAIEADLEAEEAERQALEPRHSQAGNATSCVPACPSTRIR
jgi:hypothetical protein